MTLFSLAAAPLTPAEKHKAIAQINASVGKIQSLNGTFTQTKNLKMLNDKMVSHGRMMFKAPGKLRWEYTDPYTYLFIFNGTKVYVGNAKKKDVIDTNSNKIFREVARIMMSTVTGKALTSKDEFTVDIADGGKTWNVTLVPKKKEMKGMFSKILLVFNKADSMISEVNLFEKNGDKTNIRMQGMAKNKAVNETHFTIPAK